MDNQGHGGKTDSDGAGWGEGGWYAWLTGHLVYIFTNLSL